ncbi:uncharacterized protein LOC116844770 [Odontomachus brunneus]|uniref:uncharacterized protein LOC116844770 n=1 Tax=Odontomachus brunneus TaxID=486640 RepID=UPI0013F1D6F8|nr:uncharacterized protein LOC116844770 [Odontomachus brunneus]
MNNEPVSSSSEMTPVTLSDDVLQNLMSPNCEIIKCYAEKCDMCHKDSTQNAIDLEDVSITCTETSDDEGENTSEQLSTDIEQPANQLRLVTDAESSIDCKKNLASVLPERIQRLRLEITSLQEELNREEAILRDEKEEFQFLREQSDALAFEEATAAARAATAAYAIESPLLNDLSKTVDIISEKSTREQMIIEYEKNLAKYYDLYSTERPEQRFNSYKHTFVDTYQQKLLEVERLCNEELERIRENMNYLQSFKEIASQWSLNENDRGDSSRKYIEQADTEHSKIAETNFDKNNWCLRLGKVDDEVNMTPEILSARLKREDTT